MYVYVVNMFVCVVCVCVRVCMLYVCVCVRVCVHACGCRACVLSIL